jgi:hypothetical protein
MESQEEMYFLRRAEWATHAADGPTAQAPAKSPICTGGLPCCGKKLACW